MYNLEKIEEREVECYLNNKESYELFKKQVIDFVSRKNISILNISINVVPLKFGMQIVEKHEAIIVYKMI